MSYSPDRRRGGIGGRLHRRVLGGGMLLVVLTGGVGGVAAQLRNNGMLTCDGAAVEMGLKGTSENVMSVFDDQRQILGYLAVRRQPNGMVAAAAQLAPMSDNGDRRQDRLDMHALQYGNPTIVEDGVEFTEQLAYTTWAIDVTRTSVRIAGICN